MIVLIRCNDIISDSRVKKYIEFYDRKGLDYRIIAWDRTGNRDRIKNAIYCPCKSKYDQGGFAAVKDRIIWMVFVFKILRSFHTKLQIHACDLDAAYPAILYKKFSKKKDFVLFDVFDWYSDTLYNQGVLVTMAFKYMERKAVKYSDHIIICEEYRVKQIPYDIEGKYSVLPNIPSFGTNEFLLFSDKYLFHNEKKTLSYVGGFVNQRCLDILIKGAKDKLYNLLIAGFGNHNIEKILTECNNYENIKYFGKVPYSEGLNIMYNSDIIYAMYSKQNPNHYYAAPNKYYEAVFLGKTLITTEDILVAEKVKKNKMGFTIGENYESLKFLIANLNDKEIENCDNQAKTLWLDYKDIVNKYLDNTYFNIFICLEDHKKC